MRVFVTGATGFVGSAVVAELLQAGHHVLGLTRSQEGAAVLTSAGAEAQVGTLQDPEALRAAASACDGVVHTAFNHDFSRFAASCEEDRQAIKVLGEALAGSGRPLLVTSGAAVIRSGPFALESDPAVPTTPEYPRASETATAALVAKDINARVVRLPFSVHGPGDHGFVPMLIGIARERGFAAFVGDGGNRWPAVHRRDAARVYRLALETPEASGPFHAVGEEGVGFKEIAETIGKGLGLPVRSVSPDEAASHFGFLGAFAGTDAPVSRAWTQKVLGWEACEAGLLEDIASSGYFAG